MLLSAFSIAAQAAESENSDETQLISAAYITSWNWSGTPDPTKLDIIYYSFASVDITTHKVVFNNSLDIQYLNECLALREINPDLKVLVAIGGAGADGFSQAAMSEEGREVFAQSVLDLINKYDLDGVDIDWENPVNGGWGTITAIPEDKQNCTLLMKAIREKIGDDKLLTFADGVTYEFATWVEYPELNKYIDYFNMMSYCFAAGAGKKHDANLYPSELAAWGGINGVSAHTGVQMHLANGILAEKILMGVPFYGTNFDNANKNIKYGEAIEMYNSDGYSLVWDNVAKAHYIRNDSTGVIAATIESPDSIFYKSQYVKANGLGGMMYWEYGQDDSCGSLRTAVWDNLNSDVSDIVPVTNLTATAASTTTVNLSWDASPDAACYEVYLNCVPLGRTSSTNYNVINLSSRTKYTFNVAAVSADGESRKVSVGATTPAGSSGDYEPWNPEADYYPKDSYVIYNDKLYRSKWYTISDVPGESESGAWEYLGDAADLIEETIILITDAIFLNVGEITTISASTTPIGTSYTWSTSDESVVTIESGKITAIKPGTAVIIATSASGKTASCAVTVADSQTEPTRGYYAAFKVDSAMAYHSTFGTAETDSPTITYNKRAYVPMRFASMIVGASCDYYSATKTILLTYPQCKVEFSVNSASITVYDLNDEVITTLPIAEDQVPVSIDGRVYLPARVFSQVSSMSSNTYIYYTTSEEYGNFVIYTDMEATEEEQSTMVAQADTAIGA